MSLARAADLSSVKLGVSREVRPVSHLYALSAARLARWQAGIIGFLLAGHLATQYLSISTGRDFVMGLVPAFYLDAEGNLPSFFQALTLLAIGLVLRQLHRVERGRTARTWLILSYVFLYLSVDEAAGLHEILGWATMHVLGLGFLAYAWLLPIGLAAVLLAVSIGRDLLTLPPRMLALMAASGLLFVGGAVAVEIISWSTVEIDDVTNIAPRTLSYALLVALEEGLEMTGAALFLQVLLRYAAGLGSAPTIALRR